MLRKEVGSLEAALSLFKVSSYNTDTIYGYRCSAYHMQTLGFKVHHIRTSNENDSYHSSTPSKPDPVYYQNTIFKIRLDGGSEQTKIGQLKSRLRAIGCVVERPNHHFLAPQTSGTLNFY